MEKRRRRGLWIAGVIVLAAVTAFAIYFLTQSPREALSALPPGETLTAASQGLDTVDIDAVFDPMRRTMDVRQTLTLVNRTGAEQKVLLLRTYPNAFQSEDTSPAATDELYDACYPDGFSAGSLTFTSVKARMGESAEQGASYAYGDDAHTVLRVSLPEAWTADGTLTLRLAYTVLIPEAAYRFGVNDGIWALGNAFVIPSPYLDGEYRTDEYGSIGDPFISECRNYTVRVTAPEDYVVVGSGAATRETTADGQAETLFSAPATRDFALCLCTDYRCVKTLRDGVLVQAYAKSDSAARAMLQTAAEALNCYNALYGTYPYQTLSLCETAFPFAGMEYPSLLMIGAGGLQTGGEPLEQTVTHEVAHQWWYAVVGSDEYYQAWQDEALCEFALLDYWEARYGVTARAELRYSLVDTAMLVTVPQGVTPGSPVDYFGDTSEYTLVVYQRGAAALCALDTAMQGTLDGFLAYYYDTYAFQLVTRENFETLLAAYTGEDWSPLLSDYLDTYLVN
ncbi:MAG: M1 family metallopeptidase [Eubacteriales bacterium]|nr:M1 family metallopeptidase [Eubacteriales bacterium]